MNNDLNTRVSNYYKNNPDKQQYIAGITQSDNPKVVLRNGNVQEYATIDELENGSFDWSKIIPNMTVTQTPASPEIPSVTPLENGPMSVTEVPPITSTPEPQVMPSVSETPSVTPEVNNVNPVVTPKVAPQVQTSNVNTNVSLNDVKTLFETSSVDPNSKNTLDAIIKSFAANENGEVDINKAISIITNNSMNAVVNLSKEKKCLPNELYKYDKEGVIIANDNNMPYTDLNSEIDKAFNNVLIYANGASLYGITYTPEVINQAKQSFTNNINAKLQESGLNNQVAQPETPAAPIAAPAPEATLPEPAKTLNLTLENNDEKAGFADIFILLMIVAVYAVIIVNLILKIK